MNRSRRVFFKRLIKGWKYQYGVFKSVADWTVMLYIIIPAIIIYCFIYRSWWVETPDWIENLPFILLFFILYFISWSGNIRIYIEEADKVFLIKRYDVYWGVKKRGYIYSLTFQAFSTVMVMLNMLPFLLNYFRFDYQQIFALLFYFISLSTLIMLLKYHLKKIEKKFKKVSLWFIAIITLSWFSQFIYYFWEKEILLPVYLCAVILLIISIQQSLQTIRKPGSIDYEISQGQEEKTKNIQLVFMLSPDVEKTVITKRTKPFLFRRSKRIFKRRTQVKGYIELFLKVFLRNFSYIGGYFQIISVTSAAIIFIPPVWMKIVIFTGFSFMMSSWISIVWTKIMKSNPLTKKYEEFPAYYSAKTKTVWFLFFAAILILLIMTTIGINVYSRFELM